MRARSRAAVIGADGANSAVADQCIPGADKIRYVAAYHEIVRAPAAGRADYDATRCDVYYQGKLSPDFYAWIFPHGDTVSIGVGSANKGFSLRKAVGCAARVHRPRRSGDRAPRRRADSAQAPAALGQRP